VRIFGGEIRSDTTKKTDQTGRSGVTQLGVGVEDFLNGLKQRVVIERSVGNGAGFAKGREQHRTGPIAAIALKGQTNGRSNVGGLREGSQVGTGLFVAAEEPWGKYGKARDGWLKQESPFVKNDGNEAIAWIGSRSGDEGNPLLEEGIGGNEAAGLSVLARSVMAIIAQIGSDEDKVRGGGFVKEIRRQEVEVDDVRSAIWRVDDGVEVDKRIVAGSILVAEGNGARRSFRGLGQIGSVKGGRAASSRFARGVIPHIFHVASPSLADRDQLVSQGPDGSRETQPVPMA